MAEKGGPQPALNEKTGATNITNDYNVHKQVLAASLAGKYYHILHSNFWYLGIAARIVTHPLDTMRTRMQVSGTNSV
jgi:hypothetical protein